MVNLQDNTVMVYAKMYDNRYWILINQLSGSMPGTLNSMIRFARNMTTDDRYDQIAVIIANPADVDEVIKSTEELMSYDPVGIFDTTQSTEMDDIKQLSGITDDKSDINSQSMSSLKDLFKTEKTTKNISLETERCFLMFAKVASKYNKSPIKTLEYISSKYFNEDGLAEDVAEYIEDLTGDDVIAFGKSIYGTEYTKQTNDWIQKQVDKLYPNHVKSKNEAFLIALNQWNDNH